MAGASGPSAASPVSQITGPRARTSNTPRTVSGTGDPGLAAIRKTMTTAAATGRSRTAVAGGAPSADFAISRRRRRTAASTSTMTANTPRCHGIPPDGSPTYRPMSARRPAAIPRTRAGTAARVSTHASALHTGATSRTNTPPMACSWAWVNWANVVPDRVTSWATAAWRSNTAVRWAARGVSAARISVSATSIWSRMGEGAVAARAASRVRLHVASIRATRSSASCRSVPRWVRVFSHPAVCSCRRCQSSICDWSTSRVGWPWRMVAAAARSRSISWRTSASRSRMSSIWALGRRGSVRRRRLFGTSEARRATSSTGIAAGGEGAALSSATAPDAAPPAGEPSTQASESARASESASAWPATGLSVRRPEGTSGRRAEEHPEDLAAAHGPDELPQRAVHEDQDDEPELDGPEVRPHDLGGQALIGGGEAPRMPPGGNQVLQVVHDQRTDHVDHGLPDDVVDEGFLGKAVDERQQIGEEHHLGHQECGDGGPGDRRNADAIRAEHQRPGYGHDVKGDDKEGRGGQQLEDLVLDSLHPSALATSSLTRPGIVLRASSAASRPGARPRPS